MNKRTVICAYCKQDAKLVGGDNIYPHRPDLAEKKFWKCEPCKAWVGCHPDTEDPLGRLANAELRAAKSRVHAALDPLWRSNKMTRSAAYQLLASMLGMAPKHCHIGMFDLETCNAAVEKLQKEIARQ